MAHKNRSNWSPYKARKEALGAKSGASVTSGHKPTGQLNTQPNPKPMITSTLVSSRHRKPTQSLTFHQADDRIYDVFRNHGFGEVAHLERGDLTRFYMLLMENQSERNFTRLLNIRDVAIKHFIDCLMVTRVRNLKFPLLDVGTGPGFPGIPLKIHFPNEKIILAEGVQKRVEFLKHVREKLDLKNLDIIGRNVNSEFFYPVQGVITRAVEDARNTLGNVINSVQTGGEVYLMKGPNCTPEIEMALETWGEYFTLAADIAYELPKTPHERRLLVFKKTKPHPLPDFEELDLRWEREFGRES
jgi:16S rRNA (guanine527-N7)-methyltransferase